MPASLILHPFRILTSGRVAVAEQGSATYTDSQLAVIIGTHLGERPMCEPYGVPDPAFAHLDVTDVQTCLDTFGPDDVEVTEVSITQTSDSTEVCTISWLPS